MILRKCNFVSTIRFVSELSKRRCGYNRNAEFYLIKDALLTIGRRNHYRMASTSTGDFKSEGKETEKKNRLALEKSPYLLQHATNPVEWFPWCEEALEKAKTENKMIFLSVGYSTCHWCHVMEKESFKNKDIADIMNKNFINIKVDREERPDIDRIYMTFVQAMTGHGGWPMSVFLSPDLKPIIGGTYFPPEDTARQTGFKTVLLNIAQKWKQLKTSMLEFGSMNLKTLQEISDTPHMSKTREVPSFECSDICIQQLADEFEPQFGGFGGKHSMYSPKFPQPVNFNFLFHMYARESKGEHGQNCLHMCIHSLTKMAYGGIHDHVGNGFSRYATDGEWHVPHFEKMLYDQGQLMQSYADAFLITNELLFSEIIDDIVMYVITNLRHKDGGFYSAEDADSYPTFDARAKKEGAFYVWTAEEIQSHLNKEIADGKIKLADLFCYHFNVKQTGNVKKYQDPHGELTGKNVLIVYDGVEKTAENFKLTVEQTKNYLKEACSILYEVRSARPRPHLDDKIITAWNGLMLSGLARGGMAVANKEYIQYAIDAAKFIERYLFDKTDGVLLRSCYRGDGDIITQTSVPISGFLDDYAFVIKGLLDLYEASLDEHWLEFAEELHNIQDKYFWDEKDGGYFSTMAEDPSIILRLKEVHDGAEPSGNSIAAGNLLRLAAYLNRSELRDKAARVFEMCRDVLQQRPIAFPQLVSSLVHYHDDMTQIYIVGKRDAKDTQELLSVVYNRFIPGRILFLVDHDKPDSLLFRENERLREMKIQDGRATAYVCQRRTCSLPVNSPEELGNLLDERQ